MNKIYPALIAGFIVGVLNSVTFFRSISCCLLVPASAVFTVFLYSKSQGNQKVESSDGLILGILAGTFAAIFSTMSEVLMSLIFKTNDLVESLNQIKMFFSDLPDSVLYQDAINMIEGMSAEIKENGFSFLYTILMLVNNLFINIIFGLVGGLLGSRLINKRIDLEND